MPAPSEPPAHAVAVAAELRPIFAAFLDIQRRHVAQLETALAAKDVATLSRLAHSLKGACATYQLPEAAQLALELEQAAICPDFARAGRLIAALAHYLRNINVTFVA